jgi:type VI protein secretion system component Hcp
MQTFQRKLMFLVMLGYSLVNNVSAQSIFLKAGVEATLNLGQLTANASPAAPSEFRDYSKITSVQFGLSRPAVLGPEGITLGRPTYSQMTITKGVDAASAKLMQVNIQGSFIDLIEIVYTAAGSNAVLYKVEVFEPFLSNYSISSVPGCSDGCPDVAESFTLTFTTMKVTTYSANSGGAIVANVPSFLYTIPATR